MVGGLINAVQFAHAAVSARAVGVLAFLRTGRWRSVARAGRSAADAATLSGESAVGDRTLLRTLYDATTDARTPATRHQDDHPESNVLSVVSTMFDGLSLKDQRQSKKGVN